MLNIRGSHKRLCDGLTRRDMLQAGGSALLGLTAADLARAGSPADGAAREPGFGRARNVLLLYLYGAVSQIDTLDPKPLAPTEIRGEFQPIDTALPGVQISELLPRLARNLDRVTVVRSMTHPVPIHNVAYAISGIGRTDLEMEANARDARHWPFFGSMLDYLDERQSRRDGRRALIPHNLVLPWRQSEYSPGRRAGFYGGYLGPRYDPPAIEFRGKGTRPDSLVPFNPYCGIDPAARFGFPSTTLPQDISLDRLHARQSLLEQFVGQQRRLEAKATEHHALLQQDALTLCSSPALPRALDLERESPGVRQRFGHHLFGQSTLLARRLLEAGSRVVTVLWDEYVMNNSGWDTHESQRRRLKDELCPGFDQTFAALLDDLEERGLLSETLVLVLTEHGRTPRQAQDGRDHWSAVYSVMLAGAGIKRGEIIGASDAQGAQVKQRPVSPKDILRTVYHLVGVDADETVRDRNNRPLPLVEGGAVIREALA